MKPDFRRLLIRYVVGFLGALALSLMAYLLVTQPGNLTSAGLMAVLLALAVVQLVMQLVFFLHLDIKGRSVSRTITLLFTLAMVLVLVIGSLWIMKNLDYRMGMSPEAMNEYMLDQNKKGF